MNGVVFQFNFDFLKSMFSSHIKNSIKKKSGLLLCSRLKHTKIVRTYLGHNEDRYYYYFFSNGKRDVDFVFSIF